MWSTSRADASAQDAAELMGEIDVGALPVGSAERLLGVVTDRDILYRVVAKGLDPVQHAGARHRLAPGDRVPAGSTRCMPRWI